MESTAPPTTLNVRPRKYLPLPLSMPIPVPDGCSRKGRPRGGYGRRQHRNRHRRIGAPATRCDSTRHARRAAADRDKLRPKAQHPRHPVRTCQHKLRVNSSGSCQAHVGHSSDQGVRAAFVEPPICDLTPREAPAPWDTSSPVSLCFHSASISSLAGYVGWIENDPARFLGPSCAAPPQRARAHTLSTCLLVFVGPPLALMRATVFAA